MNCKDYYNIRSEFMDGDMVLFRGNGFMSKSIRYFDDAYYSNICVVKWVGQRIFIVEMFREGIRFIPLSRRMKFYDNFCIVRIMKVIGHEKMLLAIDSILEKIERDTKYDYFPLLRIAIYKKTGIDLVGMGKRGRLICSELAQSFTNSLRVRCYKGVELITPQDFIRKSDPNEVEILYDSSPKI